MGRRLKTSGTRAEAMLVRVLSITRKEFLHIEGGRF